MKSSTFEPGLSLRLSDLQKCPALSERPVRKFFSLKASQMSKVHASSHEYPHDEKNQEPL